MSAVMTSHGTAPPAGSGSGSRHTPMALGCAKEAADVNQAGQDAALQFADLGMPAVAVAASRRQSEILDRTKREASVTGLYKPEGRTRGLQLR